jgi:hypothetical protein
VAAVALARGGLRTPAGESLARQQMEIVHHLRAPGVQIRGPPAAETDRLGGLAQQPHGVHRDLPFMADRGRKRVAEDRRPADRGYTRARLLAEEAETLDLISPGMTDWIRALPEAL